MLHPSPATRLPAIPLRYPFITNPGLKSSSRQFIHGSNNFLKGGLSLAARDLLQCLSILQWLAPVLLRLRHPKGPVRQVEVLSAGASFRPLSQSSEWDFLDVLPKSYIYIYIYIHNIYVNISECSQEWTSKKSHFDIRNEVCSSVSTWSICNPQIPMDSVFIGSAGGSLNGVTQTWIWRGPNQQSYRIMIYIHIYIYICIYIYI